jgi:hypothetical protein
MITRQARDYTIGVINIMTAKPSKNAHGNHCIGNYGIFWKKVPSSMSKLLRVWLLLRGVTFRFLWVERNDLTFNN